jgi:hypothetical protein
MTDDYTAARARGIAAMKGRPGGRTKLDAWREENPCPVVEYPTASGGWVIQRDYVRLYVHCCDGCGGLIIVRRDIERSQSPVTRTGRWPSFCQACNTEKSRKHNAGAVERMRRSRAESKASRDEQYRRLGRPIPKPRGRHVKRDT